MATGGGWSGGGGTKRGASLINFWARKSTNNHANLELVTTSPPAASEDVDTKNQTPGKVGGGGGLGGFAGWNFIRNFRLSVFVPQTWVTVEVVVTVLFPYKHKGEEKDVV